MQQFKPPRPWKLLSKRINFFTMPQQPPLRKGLFIIEDSWSHSDTPHSLGLLWVSYQPLAEASAWQSTTLTTDTHTCPGGIRICNPSRRAAADPRLKSRGQRELQFLLYKTQYFPLFCEMLSNTPSTKDRKLCLLQHFRYRNKHSNVFVLD